MFSFNAVPTKQPQKRGPAAAHRVLEGKRALIVDDNEANRRLVLQPCSEKLGAAGPAKLPMGQPRFALMTEESRNGDPYQVALIDLQMPEMGGDELGRTISRVDSDCRDTVLILLTSLGQRGNPERLKDYWVCRTA